MARCCTRRRDDGVVDHVLIERAVQGQPVELSITELRLAILLRHRRHGTGLNELAAHFNYSRSSVADVLARYRR